MVGISGFALFGQETIGLQKEHVRSGQQGELERIKAYLNAVLETVKLDVGRLG